MSNLWFFRLKRQEQQRRRSSGEQSVGSASVQSASGSVSAASAPVSCSGLGECDDDDCTECLRLREGASCSAGRAASDAGVGVSTAAGNGQQQARRFSSSTNQNQRQRRHHHHHQAQHPLQQMHNQTKQMSLCDGQLQDQLAENSCNQASTKTDFERGGEELARERRVCRGESGPRVSQDQEEETTTRNKETTTTTISGSINHKRDHAHHYHHHHYNHHHPHHQNFHYDKSPEVETSGCSAGGGGLVGDGWEEAGEEEEQQQQIEREREVAEVAVGQIDNYLQRSTLPNRMASQGISVIMATSGGGSRLYSGQQRQIVPQVNIIRSDSTDSNSTKSVLVGSMGAPEKEPVNCDITQASIITSGANFRKQQQHQHASQVSNEQHQNQQKQILVEIIGGVDGRTSGGCKRVESRLVSAQASPPPTTSGFLRDQLISGQVPPIHDRRQQPNLFTTSTAQTAKSTSPPNELPPRGTGNNLLLDPAAAGSCGQPAGGISMADSMDNLASLIPR